MQDAHRFDQGLGQIGPKSEGEGAQLGPLFGSSLGVCSWPGQPASSESGAVPAISLGDTSQITMTWAIVLFTPCRAQFKIVAKVALFDSPFSGSFFLLGLHAPSCTISRFSAHVVLPP